MTISDLNIAGNVLVNSRNGVDTVTLNNVQVSRSLYIQNSSRLGAATITHATVGKSLVILGGQSVALQSVEVQRNTVIATGRGSDAVTVDDSTFHGRVDLHTGRGADIVQIESQGDPVGATTFFDAPVRISLGAGNDSLQLGVTGQTGNRAIFSGRVYFDGGKGNDTLRNFNASTYIGKSRVRHFESNITLAAPAVPTVSSTDPADHSTNIGLNTKIAATFSEAMDPLTLTTATVTVAAPGGVLVPGVVGYVGTTMTFTPTSQLAANTMYTTTISTGAEDAAGNPLASNFVWTFTTGATADTTAPVVSSTDPAINSTGVALNKKIAATFSEAMDPLSITAASVTVTAPGSVPVAGTIAYAGRTMTFTPASLLAANTTFTTTISTGAEDLAGNPLANSFAWTFTTGAAPDITPPTVSSTDPANHSTGVALNKKIAATFSEAMDPLTITTANVTITAPGGVLIPGAVAYAGTTMTFTPTNPLAANTAFTATITTGAKDLAGNMLANNYVWSFTTGATADTTAPTVSSTDPANNSTGVALNKKIAATFSEAMDPLSITAATVTITAPGGISVPGAVAYVGTTTTFTPTNPLAANTVYTATILGGANGVKDLAANALAANAAWTFTTGATPDTTAPTVTRTSPADAQTNVALNKTIAATFSESIDPLTIAANFTVTAPGNTPVAGTVNYDSQSQIATFVPSSNFAPNTTFTASIAGGANGVKDLAGNSLASDKVWTFTTGTQIAQAPINLGSAASFAVMATASISGTGATQINGDVGLNPGSARESRPPR